MSWRIQINSGLANVIKFLLLEIVIAAVIEPALDQINRIRAQRIVKSGRPVRIWTGFGTRRDFSGPVLGGVFGFLWKLIAFSAILVALLLAEFAFEYELENRERGSQIHLRGLSASVEDEFYNGNLSIEMGVMEACLRLEGSKLHEVRVRADGRCYTGNSTGFVFDNPCTLGSTEAHDISCERTNSGLGKGTNSGGLSSKDVLEVFESNAEYVDVELDREFLGKRRENGTHVRHCLQSHFPSPSTSFVCSEFLNSGDGFLAAFSDISKPEPTLAIGSSSVVMIGNNTFTEADCIGCGLRMFLMLDYFRTTLLGRQSFVGIRPNFDEAGRVIAMIAMGLPGDVGMVQDNEDIEAVNTLVINTTHVTPLIVVLGLASLVVIFSRCVRKVINVPLDYPAAMYSAFDREIRGDDCNGRKRKTNFSVGLVKTDRSGVLHLSMDATSSVPYLGAEVQEVVPTQPQTQSQPQTMNVDSQNTNGDSHPNNSNMRDGNPSQNRRSPRLQQQRSDNNFDPRADQNASQGGGPPRYAGDDYPHQRQPPYSGDHPHTPRRDFPRTPPPYHNAPPQYPPHDGSQNRPYPHDQGYPPQAYGRYDDRPRGPADHWGPRSNPPHYDSRGRYPSPKNYSPGPPRNGAYPPQSYPPQQYPPPPHGFDPRFPPDHGPYSPHPSQGAPAPPFYGAPEPPPEHLPRNVFEQKRKELYEAIHHTIRDLRPEDSRTIDDFLDNQRYMFRPDEQEKDFLLERRGHELTLLRIQKFSGMWKVVKLKSGR